jgi:hypothetical protein
MPGPIIPGPMDCMCCSIRSMWPTIVSHISTLFRQRAISFVSLIVRRLAFIWAREAFIFSTSAFMAAICCSCICIIFWCCALGVGPLDEAGACEGAACGHAADVRVNIRTSKRLLNFIGSLRSDKFTYHLYCFSIIVQ